MKAFTIELKLVPECDEPIDKAMVEEWLNDYFVGSDIGPVTVERIRETKRKENE